MNSTLADMQICGFRIYKIELSQEVAMDMFKLEERAYGGGKAKHMQTSQICTYALLFRKADSGSPGCAADGERGRDSVVLSACTHQGADGAPTLLIFFRDHSEL